LKVSLSFEIKLHRRTKKSKCIDTSDYPTPIPPPETESKDSDFNLSAAYYDLKKPWPRDDQEEMK